MSAYSQYHCICFIWFTQQTRPSALGMPKVIGWTTQATRDTFYALSILILLAAFSIIYTTQDNGYCPSALRNMTWMPRSTSHLTARLHYCSYSSLSATVSLRPLHCDYSSPDYCFLPLTLQAFALAPPSNWIRWFLCRVLTLWTCLFVNFLLAYLAHLFVLPARH